MKVRLSKVAAFLPGATAPLFRVGNFSVESGERVLVHGPSGQGKTTLLHLLAGLMLASEGDVFLGEQNLRFLSDSMRARMRRVNIGIVFQRLNLLEHLTAEENTMLAAPPGTERAQVRSALALLGLENKAKQRTSLLSLGEQQRVAVARIVLQNPALILADEPTSSLDAENARVVIETLLTIPARPTVILVSHDERIRSHFSRAVSFAEVTQC